MKITREEVEHTAHLARLNLSDDELEKMTKQLDNILSYVAKLDELTTEGVEPTTHAFSINNAFREDVARESLGQKEALKNCLVKNEEAFIVPRVI
jgi:aspartyl-tRNA(Asn)/glutamyl-tRNA(Gln) amidotransferase subunit C